MVTPNLKTDPVSFSFSARNNNGDILFFGRKKSAYFQFSA